ncbi:hypothetical protein KAI87_16660 [Myxococcota bacterium]|nr:hypothetical protein [Myxococcota bacterium]
MVKIANQSLSHPVAQASTDNRRTKGERQTALKTLDQAISGLSSRALSHRKLDWFTIETENSVSIADKAHPFTGRTLPLFSLSKTEAAQLDHDIESIAIDIERGEFYFTDRNGIDITLAFGPVKLPREGFVFKNLISNTFRDRSAKTPSENTLRTLTNIVRRHEPEVYGKPVQMELDSASSERSWSTPDGTNLEKAHMTIEGFKYGRTGLFFDLGKREFWVEQSKGHALCDGPYKLPNNFERMDIETLTSQIDARPTDTDDSWDPSSGKPYSTVTGWDDSGSSVGGEGSGSSSVGGGGSSGSVFSYHINSLGGGGGGS